MRCVLIITIVSILALDHGVSAGAKAGKSPEEVFTAWVDAHKASGAKGFMQFLTADSKKAFTGGMLTTLHRARTFLAGKDGKELILREVDELMKRHKLDEKKLKSLVETKVDGAKTSDALIAAMTSLGEWVKDGPAFTVELIGALRFDPPYELLPQSATVNDVKIDGDTAKGTMRWKQDDKDQTKAVHFRREGGLWRIDFLPTIRDQFETKK